MNARTESLIDKHPFLHRMDLLNIILLHIEPKKRTRLPDLPEIRPLRFEGRNESCYQQRERHKDGAYAKGRQATQYRCPA